MRGFLLVVSALSICGCTDKSALDPQGEEQGDTGVFISNPTFSAQPGADFGLTATASSTGTSFTYISAEPGTYNFATVARVRNETQHGKIQSTLVTDGGFDPVAVEASVGDSLTLSLGTISSTTSVVAIKVPPRRPPRVVRTSPSNGRIDIALNIVIEVVFTEPVRPSTVSASTIRLLKGSEEVRGIVRLSADGLVAEFVPESPLVGLSDYTLVVSKDISDLDSEVLGTDERIGFKTEQQAPPGQLVVAVTTTADTGNSSLDPDGYFIQLDGAVPRPVSINATTLFDKVSPGTHQVTLSGVSDNCGADAGLATSVNVSAGDSTNAAFHIVCHALASVKGTIAFVSERDGNLEIYTINGDGTGLRRLTNHPDADFDPAWSPDGKKIAFVSTRTGQSGVWVMDADGSNAVSVAQTYNGVTQPAWSADGKQIVFSGQINGQIVIAAVPSDGGTAEILPGFEVGYSTGPSWSPDGKTLLFSSDWRAYDFVYDVWAFTPGSDPVPVLYGPFFGPWIYYFEPAWSPDGKSIAASKCPRTGSGECSSGSFLTIANKDGSNQRDVAATGGYARPSWSPDGKFIAYSYTPCFKCSSTAEVRWVAVDGSTRGVITTKGYSPSWKP